MKKIKIAITGGHKFTVELIAEICSKLPGVETVFQDENESVFFRQLQVDTPDMVILNRAIPLPADYYTVVLLRHYFPLVKIIVFTSDNSVESDLEIMKEGMHGIITKGSGIDDINTTIGELMKFNCSYSNKLSAHMYKQHMQNSPARMRYLPAFRMKNLDVKVIVQTLHNTKLEAIPGEVGSSLRTVNRIRKKFFKQFEFDDAKEFTNWVTENNYS